MPTNSEQASKVNQKVIWIVAWMEGWMESVVQAMASHRSGRPGGGGGLAIVEAGGCIYLIVDCVRKLASWLTAV